jgi:methyl-accepting chemotaxis protein
VKVNLSIRTKLLGSFAIVLAVMGGVGVYAISSLASVKSSALFIADNSVPGIKIADEATVAAVKFRKDQLHYIASLGDRDRAQIAQDLAADVADVNAAVEAYAPTIVDAKDSANLAAFDRAFKAYVAKSKPLQGLIDRGHTDAAIRLIGTGSRADHSWDQVKKGYGDLRDYNFVLAAGERANAVSVERSARTWVILLLVLGLVLSAGVGFVLTRWLGTRLSRLRSAAETIAAGDLSIEVDAGTSDELGAVTEAFARMLTYLRAMSGAARRIADGDLTAEAAAQGERDELGTSFVDMRARLHASVSQVATTAASLASSSQSMASTSEEAGQAVGEIANAVADVAAGAERQVRMISQARNASELAGETASATRAVADDGVAAADEAGVAMERVREASAAVSEAIGGLAAKSEEIGGIVQTITDIAAQTNLLALNAAIEAARAGDQGRGFAVVADEVRTLAEEATKAAGSIGTLIGQIQGETERTVTVAEHGARLSDEGAAVVERARDAFAQIGVRVGELAGSVGAIAGATEEVAAVAEQTSAATEQVSGSTEESTASAEEIAASAQEVAAAAQQLNALVSRFTI